MVARIKKELLANCWQKMFWMVAIFKLAKKIIRVCLPLGVFLYIDYKNEPNSKKIFKKYYNSKSSSRKRQSKIDYHSKKLIYMADGRDHVGGLADRLRGMASVYMISRRLGVEFKINFTSPSDLTNFLIPNKYDWRINPSDIIYDTAESTICKLWYDTTERNAFPKIQQLLKRYNQIHITTNMYYDVDSEYASVFNFLFKPTPELSGLINENLSNIGGNFIAAAFRFQALLGDFYEADYPVLPENERKPFIDKCLRHLEEIHLENPGEKILVTSESITFLNEAKKFDYVYVIPGKIAHIDFSFGLNKDVYMKSFVDYFLLTYANKIYLVIDGKMHHSGFAYRASLHKSPYVIKRYN